MSGGSTTCLCASQRAEFVNQNVRPRRAIPSSRAHDDARDATDAPVLVDIIVIFFAVLNLRHDGYVRRRARVWRR